MSLAVAASLMREFPSIEIAVASPPSTAGHRGPKAHKPGVAQIDASAWNARSCDVSAFDFRMEAFESRNGAVDIEGDTHEVAIAAGQVLTRYQRYIHRRNTASGGSTFDRLFSLFSTRRENDTPHRRARFGRSLDVWQWTLRLDAHATLAVQAAALFLDMGRIDCERADYAVDRLLDEARVQPFLRREVVELIARVEEADRDVAAMSGTDFAVLRDADALTFFSHDSADVLDGYGSTAASKRFDDTLSGMTANGRAQLAAVRLRTDVATMVGRWNVAVHIDPRPGARASA